MLEPATKTVDRKIGCSLSLVVVVGVIIRRSELEWRRGMHGCW